MTAQAVLFDLDGTLLDTSYDLFAAVEHTHQQLGEKLTVKRLDLYPIYGNGVHAILAKTLQRKPSDNECQLCLQYYRENICKNTREYPGISKLLKSLQERALPWGIVTNKPEKLTHSLIKYFNYDQTAACIIGGDTTTERKPHPRPLLYAAELINIKPENCLYIGDNLRDIQAGKAANMKTIAASYGFISPGTDITDWQADYIINQSIDTLSYV
ncbi:HAD family hydrolase [Piscirickettsia litoralis]|uniref:HAD family hydrolase n=1 Tax=Piscirickettsia litoralis TaxID=1891921 RepID=A0ABX3A465_9GAMM|nr:HAD-IA family hydrolase [Piscirickettsia litoralis]ODN43662.1 HAD family hydrolase [Piscirickettsia litoralis]